MRWGDADRYIIDRFLGKGGMGSVYAATDSVLGRMVALKVLDQALGLDNSLHAPLLREAQVAARVEHERIARIYDVSTHDGLGFVAMEYIQGGTLRQWMKGTPAELGEVVELALQIAEGLAELHDKGIVHRDLKPENVGMTKQGGVKLLDFGLARYAVRPAEDIGLPARSTLIEGVSIAAASGTPGYMAPEQYEGLPIDARVDVFAFGVILHELITGERLFPGTTIASIMKDTLAWSPSLTGNVWTGVAPSVRSLVQRMLARQPDDRPANGAAVLSALHELGISPSSSRPTPLPAAIAQLGKAPTQLAIAGQLPRKLGARIAARGVELGAVVAAAVVFFIVQRPGASHHAPVLATPPGMALIDVGTIAVGRDYPEIVAECAKDGATCAPDWLMIETPRRHVEVAPFFLDRNEVTNEDYAVLLNWQASVLAVGDDEEHHYPRFVHTDSGTGSSQMIYDLSPATGGIEYHRDAMPRFVARPGMEKLPVEQVTWYGAQLYCEWSAKRLPTEVEWEAAARGRDDRRFPWGNDPPRCGEVVLGNSHELPDMPAACPETLSLRPVGTAIQDVTPEGVHDLGGNVGEWTATPQASDKFGYIYKGGSIIDAFMARTSSRWHRQASLVFSNLGFRCAADAVKPDTTSGK
jgi:formylglycine-generating enzyme required for sulfatase activity/predicted Ser/Thr protein kinase